MVRRDDEDRLDECECCGAMWCEEMMVMVFNWYDEKVRKYVTRLWFDKKVQKCELYACPRCRGYTDKEIEEKWPGLPYPRREDNRPRRVGC